MDAASALVSGLAGEQIRWSEQLKGFENDTQRLIGDVLILTGFLSYSGPFNAEFRMNMRKSWFSNLSTLAIPVTRDLNIVDNLVDTATVSLFIYTYILIYSNLCRSLHIELLPVELPVVGVVNFNILNWGQQNIHEAVGQLCRL